MYGGTLSAAIESLAAWPSVVGIRSRDDISQGLFTLHVVRGGRRGRHLVLFRIGREGDRDVVYMLRLVHEAMDLPRHVPTPADDEGDR
jgi:toxin ParE1/3/4